MPERPPGETAEKGCSVDYPPEETPMGTAMSRAMKALKRPRELPSAQRNGNKVATKPTLFKSLGGVGSADRWQATCSH